MGIVPSRADAAVLRDAQGSERQTWEKILTETQSCLYAFPKTATHPKTSEGPQGPMS